MKVNVVSAATLDPDKMNSGDRVLIATRGGVEVRLEVSLGGSAVGVRPWYWLDGKWHPARADAASGVGIEPVTADPTKFQGRANGIFMVGPMATAFCLVVESGVEQDVVAADIREYFPRGS